MPSSSFQVHAGLAGLVRHLHVPIVLVCLAGVLLLAACGSGPSEPAAQTEATPDTDEQAEQTDGDETEPVTETASPTMEEPTADPTVTREPTTETEDEPEETPASPTTASRATPEREPEPTQETPEATATPAGPVALSSGSFTFIDNLHNAEGIATIYRLPDDTRVLRLEGFRVSDGPDLYVSLSGHPMPRSTSETFDQGYFQLDVLQAQQGNQEYVIPADVELDSFESVVIWCEQFSTVMSSAELTTE